jgi:hypothetical protein
MKGNQMYGALGTLKEHLQGAADIDCRRFSATPRRLRCGPILRPKITLRQI